MIVSETPLGAIDHPFSWMVIVRERSGARKRWTYWINGPLADRQSVADHVALYYPNVEAVTIERTTKRPDKPLQPVPSHHFQHGLLDPDQNQAIEDPTLRTPPPSLTRRPPAPIRRSIIVPPFIKPLTR